MKKWLGTLSHCLITLLACFLIHPLAGPCFYYGRELTQAEYRYIEANGGKRDDCPLLCALYPSAWTLKGLLDFLLPWVIAGVWFFCFPQYSLF